MNGREPLGLRGTGRAVDLWQIPQRTSLLLVQRLSVSFFRRLNREYRPDRRRGSWRCCSGGSSAPLTAPPKAGWRLRRATRRETPLAGRRWRTPAARPPSCGSRLPGCRGHHLMAAAASTVPATIPATASTPPIASRAAVVAAASGAAPGAAAGPHHPSALLRRQLAVNSCASLTHPAHVRRGHHTGHVGRVWCPRAP